MTCETCGEQITCALCQTCGHCEGICAEEAAWLRHEGDELGAEVRRGK